MQYIWQNIPSCRILLRMFKQPRRHSHSSESWLDYEWADLESPLTLGNDMH